MNVVERALRDFLAVRPSDVDIAIVGGVAVSARAEPRFTRDLDFAVAVADDQKADRYVFALRQQGYELALALERSSESRLSTIRLRRGGRGPFVDLLFAASGIEAEIVGAAEPIEIGAGIFAPVARTGHLIPMKLISRDDERRPRDREDLVQLARVADAVEWSRAAEAIGLIVARGFDRGRDLAGALAELRRNSSKQ